LRTYARGGEDEEPTPSALPEIRTLLDLYYTATKRGIEIDLRFSRRIWRFSERKGGPSAAYWLNLLNYAVQAVGERVG
jgi:hypothetical protein